MDCFPKSLTALPVLLIVDDEAPVRECLSEALLPCCAKVRAVSTLHEALQALETELFDVVLADICLSEASGLDLLALAKQLKWDCAIILMTGHAELNHVVASVRLQASDFLIKPFGMDTLQNAVSQCFANLLAARQGRSESDRLNSSMREQQRQLQLTRHLLSDSYRAALETLVTTLEAREPETYAHSFRVRAYALHLASRMGYPASELPLLAHAALLHDIGKVAINDAILLKPGALTREEYEVLKSHPVTGERIVNRMGFLAGAGKIIRHHHERWDGRGYPDGISGGEIPFGSRLFALADSLDAMTSDRCYRKALPLRVACEELTRCSDTQFDPGVIRAFFAVPEETWTDLRQQADGDARAASSRDLAQKRAPHFEAPPQFSPLALQW